MTRSFTNFSAFHLYTSLQFARAAQENELDCKLEPEDRAFALGAITSSVAFLESLINEVYILAIEKVSPYNKLDAGSVQAMDNLWENVALKLPILAKYELVLALNNRAGINRGAQVYDNANALIQLRNAIVHYQVGFRNHQEPEPIKIEKQLKGKFPPSAYYKSQKGPLFPHKCLGAGCAVWAANSARSYADEFHSALGVLGHYQMVQNLPGLL